MRQIQTRRGQAEQNKMLDLGGSGNHYSLELGSPQALRGTLGRIDSCGNLDVVGPHLSEFHCRLETNLQCTKITFRPRLKFAKHLNSRVVVRQRDEGWDLLVSLYDATGLVLAI
jgi:hypothetical protein